jgi:hypothetical protein
MEVPSFWLAALPPEPADPPGCTCGGWDHGPTFCGSCASAEVCAYHAAPPRPPVRVFVNGLRAKVVSAALSPVPVVGRALEAAGAGEELRIALGPVYLDADALRRAVGIPPEEDALRRRYGSTLDEIRDLPEGP